LWMFIVFKLVTILCDSNCLFGSLLIMGIDFMLTRKRKCKKLLCILVEVDNGLFAKSSQDLHHVTLVLGRYFTSTNIWENLSWLQGLNIDDFKNRYHGTCGITTITYIYYKEWRTHVIVQVLVLEQ
jgi:hypothetical protein